MMQNKYIFFNCVSSLLKSIIREGKQKVPAEEEELNQLLECGHLMER